MYPEPPWICTARSATRPTASRWRSTWRPTGSRRWSVTRLVLVGGVQDQGPGGQVLGLRVGQHGLDELVVGDAVAALGAGPGVGHALVDQPGSMTPTQSPRCPGGRGPGCCMAAGSPGRPRPPARPPGPGRRRRMTSAVQAPCWPILCPGLPTVTPRCARHQERRGPYRRRLRVGAGDDHEGVGHGGVGDEALDAVQHPACRPAPGGGDQPRRVGPGVRLGQREGGDHLAGGQPRQPLLAARSVPARTRTCPPMPLLVPNSDRKAGLV